MVALDGTYKKNNPGNIIDTIGMPKRAENPRSTMEQKE